MREGYVISLSPYQPIWKEEFEAEKEKSEKIFGDAALEIEHIGASAVEGLSSKPLIDIAVMIETYKDADDFTEGLAQIGYTFEPATHPNLPERHFYFKGNPNKYHLSVAYTDRGGFWPRQIMFRDYLRTHSEARDEYAKLKADLLRQDPSGETYTNGKTDFILNTLRLAGYKTFQRYKGSTTEPYPSATEVVPYEDYTLSVTFDSGEKYSWDMAPYVERRAFQDISDYEDFKAVRTSNDTIAWECGFTLDPDYVYGRLLQEKQA